MSGFEWSKLVDPSKWVEAIRSIPTRIWFTAALLSAGLLFAPETWVAGVRMSWLRRDHAWILALVFLVSAGVLVAMVLGAMWEEWAKFLRLKRMKAELVYLPVEHKRILLRIVREDLAVIYFPAPKVHLATTMVASQVLASLASEFDVEQGCPFTIQPWLRKHLRAHPEGLGEVPEGPDPLAEEEEDGFGRV